MKKNLSTNKIFEQIKTLLIVARNRVIQTVNTTMVYTYFEISRIIVEDEQEGNKKAKYNKQTLKQLSVRLTKEFSKGFSVTNLKQMRTFYLAYQKGQTLSDELKKTNTMFSQSQKSETLSRKFTLSWSHYVLLMRLDEKEREFYDLFLYNLSTAIKIYNVKDNL